jgi:hypothetical protein
MQDPGFEILRIYLPGTWVNKGKKEGKDETTLYTSANYRLL